MTISELEGLPKNWIANEIKNGGRFVVFSYTISILIMTFKRPTDVYFIRHNESKLKHSWSWILMSMIVGWWGFPFGPIYTIKSIYDGFKGIDVTAEILATDKELEYLVYNES